MKAYSFVLTVLFLILTTPLFTSCETDNINEENSLYETITTPQSRQGIDKGDVTTPFDQDSEDEHDNE